jgi:4a-hydroxytetrahydrobiopterin dehydratase
VAERAPADDEVVLTRTAAQRAVEADGWRFLLGALCLSVPVGSLAQACEIATAATQAAGLDADAHLRVDLRPDRVQLSLQTRRTGAVTARDTRLAASVSQVLATLPVRTRLSTGALSAPSAQLLDIAIDAMDIAAVRPFWGAVLGYVDEPVPEGTTDGLVDPAGQGPSLWFQQMDEPRPPRNRIHIDVVVAHDDGQARVDAALAAGGRLLSAEWAPSYWVLADVEGNEACVCTWLGRDERGW